MDTSTLISFMILIVTGFQAYRIYWEQSEHMTIVGEIMKTVHPDEMDGDEMTTAVGEPYINITLTNIGMIPVSISKFAFKEYAGNVCPTMFISNKSSGMEKFGLKAPPEFPFPKSIRAKRHDSLKLNLDVLDNLPHLKEYPGGVYPHINMEIILSSGKTISGKIKIPHSYYQK